MSRDPEARRILGSIFAPSGIRQAVKSEKATKLDKIFSEVASVSFTVDTNRVEINLTKIFTFSKHLMF